MVKYISLFIFLIFLDQFTKMWGMSGEFGSLNQGISFGLLSNLAPIWLQFIIFGLLLIVTWITLKIIQANWLIKTLLLAGAYSNLIDRLFYSGSVRDWISLPVLGIKNNLADWYIFLAIILFFYQYVLRYRIWK